MQEILDRPAEEHRSGPSGVLGREEPSLADPTVSIIVVNWNSGNDLGECLQSIEHAARDGPGFVEIIVVDNASSDSSLSGVEHTMLNVRTILNTNNVGFAAASNQGAALARGEYLLFLNPDARLRTNSLTAPVQYMQQPGSENVAVCGIRLRDREGSVSRTCGQRPTFRRVLWTTLGLSERLPHVFAGITMATWDHGVTRDVDHVIGAYYLIRRSVFELLGGFDNRFFVYYEDLDLSLRVLRSGFRIRYLADVEAIHEGGGASKRVKATRMFYVSRSRIQLAWKYLPCPQAAAITLAALLVEPPARALFSIGARDGESLKHTVNGTTKLWRDFLTSPGVYISRECL